MGRFLLGDLAMQYTIIDVSSASTGPVVQLDRISDFGSEGWGFESSLGHQEKKAHLKVGFFYFWTSETCFCENGNWRENDRKRSNFLFGIWSKEDGASNPPWVTTFFHKALIIKPIS